MKRMPLPTAALLVSILALPGLALGDNLLEIYEKAVRSDPQIREAEANRLATQEGKPIALGALLPQVSGTGKYGTSTANGGTTTFLGGVQAERQVDTRNTTDRTWSLELRQSVFNWNQWVTYSQAGKQSAQADVDYEAAQQSLLVRVADAYFQVLAAEDSLGSEQAAKEAIGRQLEQAQKRFEVGLIAITDVQEAQAAYDQAVASEILAKRALANTKEALRAIVDEYPGTLAKPGADLPLTIPAPADENQWVDTAMRQNRGLVSSQIGVEIAKDNISLARTGFYPEVDFVANTGNQYAEGFSDSICAIGSGNCVDGNGQPLPDRTPVRTGTGTDLDTNSLSLQVTWALFSGGSTSARMQQAVYQHRAARERLESTARETERQTRDAYQGVISDISRVEALKQAFESSKTALKATEAGYEVGTRTAVDVLDARKTLFLAETNYLRSRYDYLVNGLRLKQAAGTLTVDDLAQINTLLTDTSTAPITQPATADTPSGN